MYPIEEMEDLPLRDKVTEEPEQLDLPLFEELELDEEIEEEDSPDEPPPE